MDSKLQLSTGKILVTLAAPEISRPGAGGRRAASHGGPAEAALPATHGAGGAG